MIWNDIVAGFLNSILWYSYKKVFSRSLLHKLPFQYWYELNIKGVSTVHYASGHLFLIFLLVIWPYL